MQNLFFRMNKLFLKNKALDDSCPSYQMNHWPRSSSDWSNVIARITKWLEFDRSSQNIRPSVSKYTTPFSNFQRRLLPSSPSITTRSKRLVATSRRVSRHGFRWVMRANGPEMTRQGRRHKSVRGPSGRVWEATTPVLRGSTRGRNLIAPVTKTGTTGIVRLSHLQ